MQQMVDFILNGSNEFSPEVLIRLFVFVLTLDCLAALARAAFSIGKKV